MRKIKLVAIALVLALAGFVYAMGQAQEKKNACDMDKGACCASSCCKAESSCCKDGAACCKAEGKKAAHKTGKGRVAACACSEGENPCCKMDKSGKMQMKDGSCDMSKDGASCCGSDCCGAGCCAKEKGKTS